jgi:hypothetical protein
MTLHSIVARFAGLATCCAATLLAPAPARGQSARDSAEAAIWRLVIDQYRRHDPIVSHDPSTNRLICGLFRSARCDPDSLPSEFRSARRDFDLQNHDSSGAPRVILALAGVTTQDTVPRDGTHCEGRPLLSISRVGLDSSRTHGVLTYFSAVGAGPYPGCGYAAGATVLVARRADGIWEIVRTLQSWIT